MFGTNMAWWSSHKSGYKLGVLVLCLGSASYLIGFVSPFWLGGESNGCRVYNGLWMTCRRCRDWFAQHTPCLANPGEQPRWFKAVQGLESIGLILLYFTNVYAAWEYWCRTSTGSHNRAVEALAAFSGVCGLLGCVVFWGEMALVLDYVKRDLSWAFGLSLAGSVLVFLAAVAIYNINNKRDQPESTIAPGTIIFTEAEDPEYLTPAHVVLPQRDVFPPPERHYPQPRMSHVAPPGYGCDPEKAGTAPVYAVGHVPAADPPSPPPEYAEPYADQNSNDKLGTSGRE